MPKVQSQSPNQEHLVFVHEDEDYEIPEELDPRLHTLPAAIVRLVFERFNGSLAEAEFAARRLESIHRNPPIWVKFI